MMGLGEKTTTARPVKEAGVVARREAIFILLNSREIGKKI